MVWSKDNRWTIAPINVFAIDILCQGIDLYSHILEDIVDQCIKDEGYMITSCSPEIAQQESIYVPDEIDGKQVLAVCSSAIKTVGESNETCKEIAFGDGIRILGSHVLDMFHQLQAITLPQNLEYLGHEALTNNVKTLDLPAKLQCVEPRCCAYNWALEECRLHSGITRIGDSMFLACSALKTIWIPPTVETIGISAFRDSGLEAVVVANGTTQILDGAFAGCKKLTSAILPRSIMKIADNAFGTSNDCLSIYAPMNSYAYLWAASRGYRIQPLML